MYVPIQSVSKTFWQTNLRGIVKKKFYLIEQIITCNFSPTRLPWYTCNWNIVESGIKHLDPTSTSYTHKNPLHQPEPIFTGLGLRVSCFLHNEVKLDPTLKSGQKCDMTLLHLILLQVSLPCLSQNAINPVWCLSDQILMSSLSKLQMILVLGDVIIDWSIQQGFTATYAISAYHH